LLGSQEGLYFLGLNIHFSFIFQKSKKPEYKVVVVKVKDAMKMTHTAKFRKALDVMMNARKTDK
jgi:hypothetical protein